MILVRTSITKIVNAEKQLIDKLVEECIENVEEVKLAKKTLAEDQNQHKKNAVIVHCSLCYFQ